MACLKLQLIATLIFCAFVDEDEAASNTLVGSALMIPALILAADKPNLTGRDPAAAQLPEFGSCNSSPGILVTGFGAPIDDKNNILTITPYGPALLQDVVFIDEMAHFDRERIPERVVHAKGAGAFGFFEVTHDITRYTKMSIFSRIGKRTRVGARFSTVGGETGSADTVRDPRGFAIKFYTDEGIWDIVGLDFPTFFIRDPMLFPSFIHTQKRNPVTNLKDKDMFWDFMSLRPETTHQVMFLFSDIGIPDGHRHMDGFGVHTFKLVNAHGDAVYCKFKFTTNQGIKNLPVDEAGRLAGDDPDYSTRDLYNAIKRCDYPSWILSIQVMTFEQAETYKFNPFDVTKVWPESEFPLIPIGKLVLNENPKNFFTDIEQSAFSPSHMVPGIEPSPDKMLQGRLFSYPDTQRYRLGANHLQLPVNRPLVKVKNYQRDGAHSVWKYEGAPNYYPNSFNGPQDDLKYAQQVFSLSGDVARFNSSDEDNFTQPGELWSKGLSPEERSRLVSNIAGHLSGAADFIQKRAVDNFKKANLEFGARVFKKLNALKTKT